MLPNFRRFAATTLALEAAWSTTACSKPSDTWTPTGHSWGTENGPLQISDSAGNLAVQKPGKPGVTNPYTAATEKIVADLAYALGLPVPPVILHDRGDRAGDPRFVAVSAWAFTAPLQWQQAEALLSLQQRASLLPAASAMVPFEMWIGAQDRQNGGNVLIDGNSPADHATGAWIDYAFSLDYTWGGNLQVLRGIAPLFPQVGAPEPLIMREVCNKIAALEDARLEHIVNRIPSDYLPKAAADNIVRNLQTRKAQVGAVLLP